MKPRAQAEQKPDVWTGTISRSDFKPMSDQKWFSFYKYIKSGFHHDVDEACEEFSVEWQSDDEGDVLFSFSLGRNEMEAVLGKRIKTPAMTSAARSFIDNYFSGYWEQLQGDHRDMMRAMVKDDVGDEEWDAAPDYETEEGEEGEEEEEGETIAIPTLSRARPGGGGDCDKEAEVDEEAEAEKEAEAEEGEGEEDEERWAVEGFSWSCRMSKTDAEAFMERGLTDEEWACFQDCLQTVFKDFFNIVDIKAVFEKRLGRRRWSRS